MLLMSHLFIVLFSHSPRTKLKTYCDVFPTSCLTETPNVVQMAKVREEGIAEMLLSNMSLPVSHRHKG